MERDDSTDFLLQSADGPLLTAKEECQLARRMRNKRVARSKRAAARDRMISSNTRLVIREAYSFVGKGLSLGDLQQAGVAGLIRGVDKFDPDRGLRLSTYATHWIKQAIREALAAGGSTIRLPAHTIQAYGKWRRAHEAIVSAGGAPSFEEAAAVAGLSGPELERARNACMSRRIVPTGGYGEGDAVSMDDLPARNPGGESSSSGVIDPEMAARIRSLLSRLPLPHRLALCVRHGLCGLPQLGTADVHRLVGMTPEALRHLEDEAKQRLRDAIPCGPPD